MGEKGEGVQGATREVEVTAFPADSVGGGALPGLAEGETLINFTPLTIRCTTFSYQEVVKPISQMVKTLADASLPDEKL